MGIPPSGKIIVMRNGCLFFVDDWGGIREEQNRFREYRFLVLYTYSTSSSIFLLFLLGIFKKCGVY